MKNVFLLMVLTIMMTSCVGTYQDSICTSRNLVDLPVTGVFKQLEHTNGKYALTKIVSIAKIEGHTGLYNYEVVKGSGVNRVLKTCIVSNEVIIEFKNYKGLISDQALTFSRPELIENGFGLFSINFYINDKGESQTLNNTGMSSNQTFDHFTFREKMEVKFVRL